MQLKIFFNSTCNTQENEQFRRVVEIIKKTFTENNFDGTLIGNPHNDKYPSFASDAILIYTKGIIIIDFKDYGGEICFGNNSTEDEFLNNKWWNKTEKGQIQVKGGSSINPFKQLKKHRNAFGSLIDTINEHEKEKIDLYHICFINIFSREVLLPGIFYNSIEKKFKYYKIKTEQNFSNFLFDYANTYANFNLKKFEEIFIKFFPADKWFDNAESKQNITIDDSIELSTNIQDKINSFLKDENKKLLVLNTINNKEKADLNKFIINNFSPVDSLCYTKKISKKLEHFKIDINAKSIYSAIYNRKQTIESNKEKTLVSENDYEQNNNINNTMEIIPIASNDTDNQCLFIINEAQFVNNHKNYIDSGVKKIQFGSGQLLNDLYSFMNDNSKRKIVFIGDPFTLSLPGVAQNEISLNDKHFNEKLREECNILCDNELANYNDTNLIIKQKKDLARSIKHGKYNRLKYSFDNETFLKLKSTEDSYNIISSWFTDTSSFSDNKKPNKAIIFDSNEACTKQNLWIKENCLKNGSLLAKNDLLITFNSIDFNDEIFNYINHHLPNGTYLRVLEIKEEKIIPVPVKSKNNNTETLINLEFQKITVLPLGYNIPKTDVWIIKNFFNNEKPQLNDNEKQALAILKNITINEEKKNSKNFTDMDNIYNAIKYDDEYKNLTSEEKEAIMQLMENDKLSEKDKKEVHTTKQAKKICGKYRKKYASFIQNKLKNHFFMNSLWVKHGWAITIYKKMFDYFDEVIINTETNNNGHFFRFLYTALLDTNKAYIVNPVDITPFYKVDIQKSSISIKNKDFLEFQDDTNQEKDLTIPENISNKNVKGTIYEINKKFKKLDFEINEIKKCSEYLTKVFFKTKNFALNIDNKGKKDNFVVSNIRIEGNNIENKEQINKIIEEIFNGSKTNSNSSQQKNISDTNINKETYKDLIIKANKKNIKIELIQEGQYFDIMKIFKDEEKTFVKLTYNKEGFFSKIEISNECSEILYNDIKELLNA